MVWAVTMCLLALPAATTATACLGKATSAVKNGGFESTDTSTLNGGMSATSYADSIPNWDCRRLRGIGDIGNVDSAYSNYDNCFIHSNFGGPFGKMNSDDGDVFLILHGRVGIVQSVTGLKPNTQYTISYQMSERYGYGNDETLRLTVGGNVLVPNENAPQSFTAYAHTFTTPSNDDAIEIELANISPHKDARDGHSIYLDSIKITGGLDCGTGAECHDAVDASDDYTCKCNGRGYVGHDATNKAAECVDVTTLGSDDALAEKVEVLQEEVGAIESSVGAIQAQSKGLARSVETAAADVVALQDAADDADTARASTDAALSQVQDDLSVAQDDIAELRSQLAEVVAANSKLLAAFKAATVSVPEVSAEPNPDANFAPEVSGNAGGINFKLQPGRHATVNEQVLLTADEVRSMIAAAVAGALEAVGNAV